MIERVLVTPAASAILAKLRALHGAVMFHQSGGCCDGSSPMCYPLNEFKVGAQDVQLGMIDDAPFYMGAAQFEYWQHTQLAGPKICMGGPGPDVGSIVRRSTPAPFSPSRRCAAGRAGHLLLGFGVVIWVVRLAGVWCDG